MKKQEEKSFKEVALVGTLIEEYREYVTAAHDVSKKLKEKGIERPWITVKELLPSIIQQAGQPIQMNEHDTRIRLEIR